MKKKILSIACVLVSAITFAQVPTDGLVAKILGDSPQVKKPLKHMFSLVL